VSGILDGGLEKAPAGFEDWRAQLQSRRKERTLLTYVQKQQLISDLLNVRLIYQ
jgi:hypothetical protein